MSIGRKNVGLRGVGEEGEGDFERMVKNTFATVGKMHILLAILIVVFKILDFDADHLSFWSHFLTFALALIILVSGLLTLLNVTSKRPVLCFLWMALQMLVLLPAIYVTAWTTGVHLTGLSRVSSGWRPLLSVASYSCHLASATLTMATVAMMRAANKENGLHSVHVDEDARSEYLAVAIGHGLAFAITLAFHVVVLMTSRVTAFRVFMVVVCNGFLYAGAAVTALFVAFRPNALNLYALGAQSVIGGLSALVPLLLSLLMLPDSEYIYWAPINFLVSGVEVAVAILAALLVFREITVMQEQQSSTTRRV